MDAHQGLCRPRSVRNPLQVAGPGSIRSEGSAVVTFPSRSRAHGAVAQLVARLVRNEKVRGSNPLSSTNVKPPATCTYTGRGRFRSLWAGSGFHPLVKPCMPQSSAGSPRADAWRCRARASRRRRRRFTSCASWGQRGRVLEDHRQALVEAGGGLGEGLPDGGLLRAGVLEPPALEVQGILSRIERDTPAQRAQRVTGHGRRLYAAAWLLRRGGTRTHRSPAESATGMGRAGLTTSARRSSRSGRRRDRTARDARRRGGPPVDGQHLHPGRRLPATALRPGVRRRRGSGRPTTGPPRW
jgi:hypothetical protein